MSVHFRIELPEADVCVEEVKFSDGSCAYNVLVIGEQTVRIVSAVNEQSAMDCAQTIGTAITLAAQ